MIAYTRDEIVPVSELVKNLNKILNTVKNSSRKKIAVVRNDRLEAVIMSVREYERIAELSELTEYMDIYQTVKAREQTPASEYIDHEDILREFGSD
jgi:PHD/YefM family antitoxin component YafN of YafNO toxin-antitoxin module